MIKLKHQNKKFQTIDLRFSFIIQKYLDQSKLGNDNNDIFSKYLKNNNNQ